MVSGLSTPRGLRAGVVASLLVLAATATPAANADPVASANDCQQDGLEVLGPASVVSPVVGATTDGDNAYLVSRGLSPASVGVYDIGTRQVTANIALPSGDGGWGATVSEGDVYVGTYGDVADVYRVNPTSGDVQRVMRLQQDTFVWDLATAPDGTVVGGSSPTGRVLAYDPATGQTRDYGAADPTQMYVRSVAVDDQFIYAGTGTHANLVRIDRDTGERTSILPPELAGESWVYSLTLADDVIVAGTEPSGHLAVIDRDQPSSYQVIDTGKRTVDQVRVLDGVVWMSTRSDGGLMRYDLATQTLSEVTVPSPGEETRLIAPTENTVFGVTGSGAAWYLDRSTGDVEVVDLQDAGLRAGPEGVQSLAASGGRAYVGGHWSLTEHRPDSGERTRVRVSGEPKAMEDVGPRVYFAEYPGALIRSYDRDGNLETAAEIPKSAVQNRPRDVYYDRASRLLLVASMAEYGYLDGALTTYDPGTGQAESYRGLVDDQTIDSVVAHRGVAYLSTQVGASGIDPTTTEAHLAAFDLSTRELLWQDVPLPGVRTIRHIAFLDGLIYGYTGDGLVFSYDPRSRAVVDTVRVGGSGEIEAWNGRLFVATGDSILEIDPATLEPTALADCLGGGGWFNEPQLAIDDDEAMLYTMSGRDLARISLDQ
jgi:streptogramin lyase